MNNSKSRTLEYYDGLKNQIDIDCEIILADPNVSTEKKDKYNSIRTNFLNEIDRAKKIYLDSLQNNTQTLKNNEIDCIISKDRFCTYIPWSENIKKKLNDELSQIGKLVITNFYLSDEVRSKILASMNNKISFRYDTKMSLKNDLIFSIVNALVTNVWPGNDGIIDLCNREKNIIHDLDLEPTDDELDIDCIDLIDKIIDKKYLESCTINFECLSQITIKSLDFFSHIKNFELWFNKDFKYEPNLFSNFKNLENLILNRVTSCSLPNDLLTGLKNLKNLEIIGGSINSVETNAFADLVNLDRLNLHFCMFESVCRSNFEGLDNLRILNMHNNLIKVIHTDAFVHLKNLKYLNLTSSLNSKVDIDCFNVLENLQFLSLLVEDDKFEWTNIENLCIKKLKFLALDGRILPRFEHLLNLNFVHIRGLYELTGDFFMNKRELTGLKLEFAKSISYDSLSQEVVQCLNKLSFVSLSLPLRDNNRLELLNNFIYLQPFKKIISKYGSKDEYFKNELHVDQLVKDEIVDYYNKFLEDKD